MATGLQVWSTTPVNNATSDSNVNFAEGQAPSSVNDSCRALMASAAKWRADMSGVLVTSGTSSALTLATNQVESALTTGFTVSATLGTSVAAAATLAVDGLTATSLFTGLSTSTLVTTGQYTQNQVISCMFSTGVGPGNGWVVLTPPNLPPSVSFTPANSAAMGSASIQMAGFGTTCTFTPIRTGRVLYTFECFYNQAANVVEPSVTFRFGTGTAPANAAAATGTVSGTAQVSANSGAGFPVQIVLTGVITGLTPGTAVWFDIGVALIGSNTTATAYANPFMTLTEI